jgi:hypothetical protein
MAGLDPAIHVFLRRRQDVDARHKAGHDVIQQPSSLPDLIRQSMGPRRTFGQSAWTAGSSPAVTM